MRDCELILAGRKAVEHELAARIGNRGLRLRVLRLGGHRALEAAHEVDEDSGLPDGLMRGCVLHNAFDPSAMVLCGGGSDEEQAKKRIGPARPPVGSYSPTPDSQSIALAARSAGISLG